MTTLLYARDGEQRLSLAHGLIQSGHEVVTPISLGESVLYLENMPFSVVVMPAGEWLDAPPPVLQGLLDRRSGQRGPMLVILGDHPQQERTLRTEVVFVPTWDVADEGELLQRLRLVLLGAFLDLPPDESSTRLVGSIAQRPFLSLAPKVAATGEACRVDIDGVGSFWCREGNVVAARQGKAVGTKAFCRMARSQEGAFHITLDDPPALEIIKKVAALVQEAVVDSLGDRPDPRSSVTLAIGPELLAGDFDAEDQMLLSAAQHGADIGQLLDVSTEPDSTVVDRILGLIDQGTLLLHPPVRRVAVITDSTSDLPQESARDLLVDVVPLSVHFGERAFWDRQELTPKGFYELLLSSPHHPYSQPPTPERFAEAYQRVPEGTDIVSIHISEQLSKTCEHARDAAVMVAAEAPERRIEVIDSGQVSLGLGLVARFASRLAAKNVPLDILTAKVRELAERTQVLFAVDTLEFLERGGRIGKMQAMFGSLMRVKPILGIAGGKIVPVDRVRGGRNVHPKLLELMLTRIDPKAPVMGYVAHANAPQWADRLQRLLSSTLDISTLDVIEIGSVVGTHTGPGAIGVALCSLNDDDVELLS